MYIVIEMQTMADGSVGNFVWSFQTRDEAFAKYFSVLSAAAVSSLPVHSAAILDNFARQIAGQPFEHEVEPNE